jgi:hypothetical protein
MAQRGSSSAGTHKRQAAKRLAAVSSVLHGLELLRSGPRDGEQKSRLLKRFDPVTKRPVGDPIGYEHFHNSAGRDAASYPDIDKYLDLSVARDKMLINLPQLRSDIWMTQIE